ncbi:hypothetical protein QCA50_010284 [Cerrena zonata]|uniref:F-box domain-containing protein n=1 Tax=Cerrena zonata TaxID=2478898 RepID=A0AAW0G4S6_9APHY
MSQTHDIDNDEGLFQFDVYDSPSVASLLKDATRDTRNDPVSSCREHITMQHHSHPVTASGSDHYQDYPVPSSSMRQESSISDVDVKGKGISQPESSEPMPIIPRAMLDSELDLFTMSFGSAGSSSRILHQHAAFSPYTPPMDIFHSEIVQVNDDEEPPMSLSGKGKARELPPSLPPLSFSPTEFTYGSSEWPSLAGPSSYGSNFSEAAEPEPSFAYTESTTGVLGSPPSSPVISDPSIRAPLRTRSLSNLSTRSLSNVSISKLKLKMASGSKSPTTIARKLLFRRRDASTPSSTSSPTTTPSSPLSPTPDLDHDTDTERILANAQALEQSGTFIRWSKDMKPRTPLASPVVETDAVWGTFQTVPRSPRPTDPHPLRTKGRSYSSPLPLPTSVLDIVPLAPADILSPQPVIKPCYFDEWLPREVKLEVFRTLVEIFQGEFEKRVENGKWTANKAGSSRNRWVGRDKGIRELFKISRVCKSWQTLVFDGQLWEKLDLRSFPKLPPTSLCRISSTAGGFIKQLDLTGHTDLLSSTLIELTEQLSNSPIVVGELPHTHLTSLNLQGCSSLSTRSIHGLLIRSPLLEHLSLKGLTAVTNTTCDLLSVYCPRLISLDMSRCFNMNGEGVLSASSAAVKRGEYMQLKQLRLSGLERVSDEMMRTLGRAAPYLEVLDLSCCRDIHNSSIEAFVTLSEDDLPSFEFDWVQLTSREAGRDPSDYTTRYWRRITQLRHLNLSCCILLTDHACSHLAHAVPKLEFLELASIGPELGDDGLVRLLKTTPGIRKLDLEDDTEISDDLLVAITPSPPQDPPATVPDTTTPTTTLTFRRSPPPEPGHALEHIVLSYADVNSDTLTELVRNCTKLKVLEADNTRMSGLVLREFVQLAHSRSHLNARIVAVDCRGVGEYAVKEVTPLTRPRLGWRSHHARKLNYLDARDDEGHLTGIGQDECDEKRVVVKTFYSWQTVDAVCAAREKKRKSARRGMNSSGSSTASRDDVVFASGRARWWSPSGRRASGPGTPTLLDANGNREGCIIM